MVGSSIGAMQSDELSAYESGWAIEGDPPRKIIPRAAASPPIRQQAVTDNDTDCDAGGSDKGWGRESH